MTEPWHAERLQDGIAICDANNRVLAMLGPQNKDLAHRIIAAVNGCRGISTQALRAGAVQDMVEALVHCLLFLEQYAKHAGLPCDLAMKLTQAALAKVTPTPTL